MYKVGDPVFALNKVRRIITINDETKEVQVSVDNEDYLWSSAWCDMKELKQQPVVLLSGTFGEVNAAAEKKLREECFEYIKEQKDLEGVAKLTDWTNFNDSDEEDLLKMAVGLFCVRTGADLEVDTSKSFDPAVDVYVVKGKRSELDLSPLKKQLYDLFC